MEKARISSLLEALCKGIYEKDHVLALSLLAAVAGESIFFLGPPGTGKSMLARRMKQAFRGGRSFEYLMSRFSTPDEIFGPVSVAALKDEGRYVRMTDGYLPTADVVFLDELWKAGPSIQNALLTVLNEKLFLNGNEEMHLPLKLVVAASNELPAEGENLEALWDRFLLRCVVGGISDRALFNQMVAAPAAVEAEVPDALRLSEAELAAWAEGIEAVSIPGHVFSFVHALRSRLAAYNASDEVRSEPPFYVSDRRWKKTVHLWRTSAFLNGRSEVAFSDVLLSQACFWDALSQEAVLSRLLSQALADACGERIGLPLLSERIAAMKEDGHGVSPRLVFKVVRAFFYQVESLYPGRTVLIYVSEYEALGGTEPVAFVLVDDRKTGAQVLRKYDKARFPGVFPKDLLQVVRTEAGLTVNGRKYNLVQTGASVHESALPSSPVQSSVQAELVKRITAELDEAAVRLDDWEKRETTTLRDHLFLAGTQKDILKNAMHRVRAQISSLQIEVGEWAHAVSGK